MAGRRRRVSSSTVATIDDRQTRWVKETAILKPAPSSQEGFDACNFVLTDAIVYLKDGKTMASVLDVDREGPFIIRGVLEIDEKEQVKSLINRGIRSYNIEIPVCRSYSIGYDPLAALWVAGEAGWFELVPHPRYAAIHNTMCKVITLYYVAMSAYEKVAGHKSIKKQKQLFAALDLDEIFFKYAVAIGDGCVKEDVVAMCMQQAPFLLSHMPKERPFIWNNTSFSLWLHAQNPGLAQKLLEPKVDMGVPPPAAEPIAEVQQDDDDSEGYSPAADAEGEEESESEDEDVDMADAHDISSSRAANSTPQISRPLDNLASRPKGSRESPLAGGTAPLPAIDKVTAVIQEIGQDHGDRSKLAPSTVHTKLFYKCKLKEYNGAKEVTSYFARELVQRLTPLWQGTPFLNALKVEAAKPRRALDAASLRDMTERLDRRKSAKPFAKATTTVKTPSSVTDSDRPTRRGMKNLQPPMTARPSGKAAGLRLASSSKKRFRQDIEEDTSDDARGKKAARTSRFFAQDEEDESDASQDSDGGDSNTPADGQPVRLIVRAYKQPSLEATGINGTWKCEEEGCDYFVRATEDGENQELIRSHFRDHEAQASRVELALAEGNRGHNPINHLLEKIRAAGEGAVKHERVHINGRPVPKPIKPRLLF